MNMYRPTPAEIAAAIRDYGVPVVEHGRWQTRGTEYDASFYGSMNHHDALSENVSDARALDIMVRGRPDLRGPLCNGWGDSDGVYYLVAYGNANHAGRGEWDVLERTRQGLAPLGDARDDPDKDSLTVGNTWYWGSEWRNAGDGRDPYEQLDTMISVNAALVDVFQWPNSNVCIGHKEWTARKIDPAGFDMPEFRRLINHRRAEHHAPQPTPTQEDYDMFTLQRIRQPWPAPPAEPDTRIWCVADDRQSCRYVSDLDELGALQDILRRAGRDPNVLDVYGAYHVALTHTPGWHPLGN